MKQNDESNALLFKLIEQLGTEWGNNYRPEDLRLDLNAVQIFRSVNEHIAGIAQGVEAIKLHCPNFVRVYRDVMLRDIEEPIGNEASNQGGSAE